MHRTQTSAGFSLLLLLTACGATDGTDVEEVDAITAEFAESSCLTAQENAVIAGVAVQSPTTYDNPACRKTWVSRVDGAFPSNALGAIFWTDPWNRNEVQCRNGKLRLQVMSRGNPPIPLSYRDEGTFSFPLFWDAAQGVCFYPSVELRQHSGNPPTVMAEYEPARGANFGIVPNIPGAFTEIPLPRNLTGRTVRIAAQNLTPAGSTQSVTVVGF